MNMDTDMRSVRFETILQTLQMDFPISNAVFQWTYDGE